MRSSPPRDEIARLNADPQVSGIVVAQPFADPDVGRRLVEHIDPDILVGRYVPNLVPRMFNLGRDFVQEIADLVGCPLSTVKTRLYQGLTVLRRELAKSGKVSSHL